jgi:hypothetical protein
VGKSVRSVRREDVNHYVNVILDPDMILFLLFCLFQVSGQTLIDTEE